MINMSKKNVKDFERIQKDSIYDILGLSRYANYNAVLSEIGILRAEDTMKLRKINFINSVMHTRESNECRDVLMAADRSIEYTGLVQEVREYCAEYGLPDVVDNPLRKRDIDDTVKKKAVFNGWFKLRESSKVLMRWLPEKKSDRSYFKMTRIESKLMLALQIGELNFLTNRKHESLAERGSTDCYVGVCGGQDTLDHVSQCFGYQTKPPGPGAPEQEIANYLVELNKERTKRFKSPLVIIRN